MARGTKKRGAGEGTIYYREAKRLWCAQGTLEDGRRKTIYGKTQREVREQLTLLSHRRDRGVVLAEGQQTVAQYLAEWLVIIKPTVRESTWIRYRQLVDVHLVPGLGRHKLSKLSAHQVQQFCAAKLAEGAVSPTTVRRAYDVLRHALHHAMRRDLVMRNVAELVDPPRAAETEMRFLSPEQVAQLIEAARDERLGALYVLAVTTGMRAGELLALRWRDVDLSCGTAQVRASLTRTTDGYVIGKPKTKSSERKLTLPPTAHEALKAHWVRQLEERMALGELWQKHDLVFPTGNGAILDLTLMRHHYRAFLRRHALPEVRFHDLRHTAATTLLGERENLKIVSAQLGHSTIAITANLYMHVTEGMQAGAAETMERAIRRAAGKVVELRQNRASER